MRSGKILIFIVTLYFLAACSAPKVMTSMKTSAKEFESHGNLDAALNSWEQYFSQTSLDEIAGADFADAAKTAYRAENLQKAVEWFDQARYKNYADAEMYETLAEIFHKQDNLSKELSVLEVYTEKFGKNNSDVNSRLFEIYAEIGETQKAQTYWSLMNEVQRSREDNLVRYLELNKKLQNDVLADSIANEIVKLNPEQFEALDWLAKKYYWEGQNRYNREMKAYEQNKTRKQYRILLEELDKVTIDFKKALPYLEKLWEQKPGKEYAAYFANIYARFGNEEKANFYKKYTKD